MAKIKLLHVTSSLKIGGAEAVLCDLVRKLGNQEFEHHIIYFHEGPNLEELKKHGAFCYKISGLLCLYDPVFFMKLFFLVKKLKPNVMHSLLWSANIASRLVAKSLKIPSVSVYHNNICIYGKFKKFLDKITQDFSNCIVAVSDDVAISLGQIKNASKLKVIKNGLDFYAIHSKQNIGENGIRDCARKALGLEPEDFVVGTVGRFSPEKNIQLLIKSFALVSCVKKNVKLVIVGIGPQEDYLRGLACQLGLVDRVVFVVGKKACDYYNLFDCFVQSSAKEGLSIALLEAMSFRLPCIVTNTDMRHPVIRDLQNGLIVVSELESELESEKALCQAIITIIESPELSQNLAKNAKQDVLDNFDIDNTISQYRDILIKLAKIYS